MPKKKPATLEEQIAFAHHRIERLSNELLEVKLLACAVMRASAASGAPLQQSFESERQMFLAIFEQKELPDEMAQAVMRRAAQAVRRACARPPIA